MNIEYLHETDTHTQNTKCTLGNNLKLKIYIFKFEQQ